MCTDFLLLAEDATVVNGRSMEFGSNLNSEILICGKGTKKQSLAPDLKEGLGWTTEHGYIGMNAYGTKIVTDGMNEAGLSIGALWLPGVTRYPQQVSSPANALAVDLFTSWVLGTCTTIDDVKAKLNGGQVEIWGNLVLEKEMPLHFPIHDDRGRSMVIEFTDGMQIYDNPVAVLTNAPPFPWQLTNIDSYVGLSATDAAPIEIGLDHFSPPGHGSGMRGLPGDSTPPSRFIRTVFQKRFAHRPKTSEDACNLALHLLNTVDIPVGTSASRPTDGKAPEYDYTQWIVIKALTRRIFNFRTYDNPTIMQVDLRKLDFSMPGERLYPLPAQPTSVNITDSLGAR